tara:strand:- start:199 stop:405 length:207 start_codon:yes stop_codon:yes gene_type:complete
MMMLRKSVETYTKRFKNKNHGKLALMIMDSSSDTSEEEFAKDLNVSKRSIQRMKRDLRCKEFYNIIKY